MIARLLEAGQDGPAGELLNGLFGPTRRLYKRLAQYSFFQQRPLYGQLARRPYAWLAACGEALANAASRRLGRRVAPHEVLLDAPPVGREVEFHVEIHFPKERCYRPLADVSPVARTLARKHFDDFVKRVRVFAHPRVIDDMSSLKDLPALLQQAIEQTG
jgi:hypothetical protein